MARRLNLSRCNTLGATFLSGRFATTTQRGGLLQFFRSRTIPVNFQQQALFSATNVFGRGTSVPAACSTAAIARCAQRAPFVPASCGASFNVDQQFSDSDIGAPGGTFGNWSPLLQGAVNPGTRAVTPLPDHPTAVQILANATAPSQPYMLLTAGPNVVPSTQNFKFCVDIAQFAPIPTAIDASVIVGISNPAFIGAGGQYIALDSGLTNWQLIVKGPTTSSSRSIGVPVDGTFHLFEVERLVGGPIVITVDGTIVKSFPVNESDMPNVNLQGVAGVNFSLGASLVPPDLRIDLFSLKVGNP